MSTRPVGTELSSEIVAHAAALKEELELSYDDVSVQKVSKFVEVSRESLDEESREQLIFLVGSFLGEAIIAANGGTWVEHEDGLAIRFDNGSVEFPFTKTQNHIDNGAEDNIHELYRDIPALLGEK